MPGIGGTVANVLAVMELLDNELETGSGAADEASAILALTQAQHYFETLCAAMPEILQTTTNITTAAATETTTISSSLLRFDALWYLDANGNPIRKLMEIDEVGGHVPALPWPLELILNTTGTGTPYGYYASSENFYWLNRPDATYTIRLYGFIEKAEFALRTDDFNYPKRCHLAFAQFANRILDIGVDDATVDLEKLASTIYQPLLRQLRKRDRSKPHGRVYTEFHTT